MSNSLRKPADTFREEVKIKGNTKHRMDTELLVVLVIMILFGLIMVASASSATAFYRKEGNSMFFFEKQMFFAAIGFVLMIIISNIDYHFIAKPGIIVPAAIISWGLTFVPVVMGPVINGAKRWIVLPGTTFQPSELLKITAIVLVALIASMQTAESKKRFVSGTFIYLCLIGTLCLPLLLQPHKSAIIIIGLVCLTIVIISGSSLKHYFVFLPPLVAGFGYMIYKDQYSLMRILSFLDPFKDPKGSGWQAIQSLYAIGSGGFFGLGLGRSVQKFLYIPEPQNDFIFSIICEELGFIGAAFVVILFAVFFIRCIKISLEAKDLLGCLIGIGLTSLIMYQAVINIGVVTGVLPVTGMPLPFFSAGGTSILFTIASMGILLNISKQKKTETAAELSDMPIDREARRKKSESNNSGRGNGRTYKPGLGNRRRTVGARK